MRLLIVEDSARLRTALCNGLKKLGYSADPAVDGQEALSYIACNSYDVIILDIMMPKLDGLSVLKKIRSNRNKTHVLLLSARDQVQDRILGLEAGADDYLIKPFAFDELHARINSLIRRAYEQKNPLIKFDCYQYNTALKALHQGQQEINLTRTENTILECLLLNRGRVVRYDTLESLTTNPEKFSSRNALEAQVSTLRKKLKTHSSTAIVQTKRGFGYYIKHDSND